MEAIKSFWSHELSIGVKLTHFERTSRHKGDTVTLFGTLHHIVKCRDATADDDHFI